MMKACFGALYNDRESYTRSSETSETKGPRSRLPKTKYTAFIISQCKKQHHRLSPVMICSPDELARTLSGAAGAQSCALEPILASVYSGYSCLSSFARKPLSASKEHMHIKIDAKIQALPPDFFPLI
jgi:hypothetical protein